VIAVDTSALMAILLGEEAAPACANALSIDRARLISATTVAEALVVSHFRGISHRMQSLVISAELDVVATSRETAERVLTIYRNWGKGAHPAHLNLFDCFAYDVAKTHDCPLLYVGNDFARTDIRAVL
jgi:ribonuclease VapC